MTAQMIRVETLDTQIFPDNLGDFALWLADRVGEIPKEHFETATIEIEGEDDYGSTCVGICISYLRPETADEIQFRESNAAQRNRDQEIETLRKLRAKYPLES